MAAWRDWGRYLLAAAASAGISWLAFGAGRPVPILDWFDLGVHEAGHLVTGFLPDLIMFLAGSVAQVAVPLGLAAYFLWGRGEWASAGFCTAWAATSVRDVSVYIADAPRQALPLVGGGIHDWAWLLGSQGFGGLDRAAGIARGVQIFGLVLALAGMAVSLWPVARPRLAGRRRVAAVPAVVRQHRPASGADPAGDPWLSVSPSSKRSDAE